MTIRVAILVADLGIGGIQSMVAALGRGLDRSRYAAAYLCFDGGGKTADALESEGFAVRRLVRRPGLDLRLPGAIARACTELRADVLHAHNRTALFHAVLARAGRSRPRLVYTEHDRSFPEKLKVRCLQAVLARRVDSVAAVCSAVREAIVATEKFPADRTHVVVNGIADPAIPADRGAVRGAVRSEFGVPEGRPLLLAIGHLTPVKDHDTLLAALALIEPAARPRLVIAGDGVLRPSLEARRASLGLEPDVVFAGYRDDVPRLLLGCDALVMSSVSEGLSIALVEAAARGVPIVATAVGGNAEVTGEGADACGLLVPPRDPAALAREIRRIVSDAALAGRLRAAGRRRFEERFRLATMVERYQDIYSRVAAAP